jgi:dihydrofolate reductase
MAIIGIVAVARNNAIGKDGKLPWHYPADLKHFKETTTGQAVVMGMNTWRSIGKALPNRLNIVLSRSAQIDKAENLIFLRSEKEALDLAKFLKCDLFVIGGSKTYAEFANTINAWIVTRVPVTVEDADVFMPDDFLDGFEIVESREVGDSLTVETFRR